MKTDDFIAIPEKCISRLEMAIDEACTILSRMESLRSFVTKYSSVTIPKEAHSLKRAQDELGAAMNQLKDQTVALKSVSNHADPVASTRNAAEKLVDILPEPVFNFTTRERLWTNSLAC